MNEIEYIIEGGVSSLDEACIGLHLQHGEDEKGQCHILTIGLLLFWVTVTRYRI